jgi:hypothetical protein
MAWRKDIHPTSGSRRPAVSSVSSLHGRGVSVSASQALWQAGSHFLIRNWCGPTAAAARLAVRASRGNTELRHRSKSAEHTVQYSTVHSIPQK